MQCGPLNLRKKTKQKTLLEGDGGGGSITGIYSKIETFEELHGGHW